MHRLLGGCDTNGAHDGTREMDTLMERLAWWTKTEAAKYARVSIYTIERAIKKNELRAGGTRGAIRIRPEWVDEWLEQGGNRRHSE